MKKIGVLVSLIFLSSVVYAKENMPSCLCEDLGLEASAKTGMFSSYVSRGVMTDNDPVVQNDFFAAYKGFNFDYWMSMPATTGRDTMDSNEIDLTLSYGFDISQYSFRFGHISYQYSIVNALPTREWFVSVSANSLPVSLCFTYFNDYDQFKGSYFAADIDKTFSSGESSPVSITPFLHIGAYNDYSNYKSGGDLVAGSKASFKLLEHLDFVPSLGYSIPYGDTADENIGNQKAVLFGGANFEFSF